MDEPKMNKVKQHFVDHKIIYIAVGALIVGVVIGKLVSVRVPSFNVPITNNNSPIINIPIMSNNTAFGGHSHKLVKCLETGGIWETVKDAASAAGVEPSTMSKHINGHKDHVRGLHYAIIGLGAGS